MSRTSIKNKLNIQTVGTSLPSIQSDGEVSKHPQTGQLLVSNNNNWEPINSSSTGDVPFSNYYVRNSLSNHTSPELHDLVYEISTNNLWRYHGDGTNHVWQRIDYFQIAKIHPEFKISRLRTVNNYLEISPNGTNWFQVLPLVGAKIIRLDSTAIDNTSYSRLYWLPLGITANIAGANHLPIAFAKDSVPCFSLKINTNTSYEPWVGLRPNGTTLPSNNGEGQFLTASGGSVAASYTGSLSFFPLYEQSSGNSGSENFHSSIISFSTINTSILLGRGLGLLSGTIHTGTWTSRALASSTLYWFGTWFRQDNQQFTPYFVSIIREF